jgi:hypothetical protein
MEHLPQLSTGETGEMYGIIIEDNCLEPLVLDGDHAIVAPGMRYEAGDFVAIWPSDPSKIPQIKRMVLPPFQGWRRAVLHPGSTAVPVCIVEMLNPHRQLCVDLGKIAAIHRVAAWFDADRVELIQQGDAATAFPMPTQRGAVA